MYLQVPGDQDSPFRSQCSLPVLIANSPAQLDDVAGEAGLGCDLDDEPLQPDGLVGVDGPAEADPELEADHGGIAGVVRGCESQQEGGRVSAAGDGPSVAC